MYVHTCPQSCTCSCHLLLVVANLEPKGWHEDVENHVAGIQYGQNIVSLCRLDICLPEEHLRINVELFGGRVMQLWSDMNVEENNCFPNSFCFALF